MSDFKEFMDEIEKSPTQALPASGLTLPGMTAALTAATFGLLAPFSFPSDEKQKFSEKVSSLIQDESFLNDFSNQIGEPLADESEDAFVDRGSNALRQMLYDKFGLKN